MDAAHQAVTAEQLFGVKTGRHTHPVTHPLWLEFTDGNCPVCPAVVPDEA